MKKILPILLVFGALTAAAEDSYLYWMIGDTTPYSTTSSPQYDTVKVRADSGTYLNIGMPGSDFVWDKDSGITAGNVETVKAANGALFAYLGADLRYSSFVVELWNDGNFVAQSREITMSEATANYYIATSSSMTLPSAWMAQSFAIPEPNSAMLLLLGCAALGLRRRRLNRS